jgi:NodT family efflux transporter outer membrane factor (OMF) lipoprotein
MIGGPGTVLTGSATARRRWLHGALQGALLGAVVTAMGGCAVGPDYRAPAVAAPDRFVAARTSSVDATAAPPQGVDSTQWWHTLQDPELDTLVSRAIHANPDIEIALTRLQEARTGQRVLVGAVLPEAGASAAGGRGTGSDAARIGGDAALRSADDKGSLDRIGQVAGFAASWEIDLFGGRRRAIEAGRADIGAAAAARSAVLLGVVGELARDYVALRGLQQRLAILQQNVASTAKLRDLEQVRFDRGIINELDLQLAIRELSGLQSQLPPIQSALQAAQYRIAVLIGEYPEELGNELAAPGPLPALPAAVSPGLPVELLARRPDVREAERALAAATARIGVATADLFPRVLLTGASGVQSADLGIHGSHIWEFGPALYWPLLDFGALDARVDIADLQAHERLVRFHETLIGAVSDADTAIADYGAQQQRLGDLAPALLASRRALSLAQQRYDRGLTDFLNVVDAERVQFELEDAYVLAQQSAAEAFIYLCQALGGGWESYQQVPPIRLPEPAVFAGLHRLLAGDDPRK